MKASLEQRFLLVNGQTQANIVSSCLVVEKQVYFNLFFNDKVKASQSLESSLDLLLFKLGFVCKHLGCYICHVVLLSLKELNHLSEFLDAVFIQSECFLLLTFLVNLYEALSVCCC